MAIRHVGLRLEQTPLRLMSASIIDQGVTSDKSCRCCEKGAKESFDTCSLNAVYMKVKGLVWYIMWAWFHSKTTESSEKEIFLFNLQKLI